MKDLFEKISSYNLFNYLFPGIVFVILAKGLTKYSFIQLNIIIGLFFYYFIGLVISRIGSLIIEPILKYISFIHFVDYRKFVAASKEDGKLEILSEVNNIYRTLCSTFLLLIILKLFEKVEGICPSISDWRAPLLLIALLILFLLSYRKQTEYITKRIQANRD